MPDHPNTPEGPGRRRAAKVRYTTKPGGDGADKDFSRDQSRTGRYTKGTAGVSFTVAGGVRSNAALLRAGSAAAAAGRYTEALALYEQFLARVDAVADEHVQWRVADALAMKAWLFGQLGRVDDELATYDVIVQRYGAAPQSTPGRNLLVDCLRRKARALEHVGRTEDAVGAFDDALTLQVEADNQQLRRLKIETLTEKGLLLARCDRSSEAGIVIDSAVGAYADIEDELDGDAELLGEIVLALLRKVVSLCASDPSTSVEVVQQLRDLLGDVADPPATRPRPASRSLPEEGIAEFVADLWRRDCWHEFARHDADESVMNAVAQRALELYRETEGWLTSEIDNLNTPVVVAAGVVRQIADGYALLAQRWSASNRERLSMPSEHLLTSAIRTSGLDQWLAARGHPVELNACEDLIDDLIRNEHEKSDQVDADLAGRFIASVRQYEMLEILCGSPRGRAALKTRPLRGHAAWRLSGARSNAGWAWQQLEHAAGAAVVGIYVAEAYFVAAHAEPESSADIFPTREFLRSLLRDSDTYGWLETQDIELPDWLKRPAE